MNRDDILREFGVTQLGQITMHHEDMADEIVHLRRQVRKLEHERDAMEGMYRHHVEVALDAIAKLNHAEHTIAALREPSEAR